MVDWRGYGTSRIRKKPPPRINLGTVPSDLIGVGGELVDPDTYVRGVGEMARAMGELNPSKWRRDPGYALRQLARTPAGLLPLIPTAAQATTPGGRREMAEHPLFPLLDVASSALLVSGAPGVAARVGRTGATLGHAAKAAEGTAQASRVARAARLAKRAGQVSREISREEAARQPEPVPLPPQQRNVGRPRLPKLPGY